MGKDLQRRADLLVMELFDYGFLGEGCLHFVHFAWNNCLAEDGAIMPRGLGVYICDFRMTLGFESGGSLASGFGRWSVCWKATDLARVE